MKYIKKIAVVLSVIALLICSVGCDSIKYSNKETKYYVIYSHILNNDGLLCGIDEDGNYTSSKKIKLQDGTKIKLIDGKTIVGGSRANTNIILDSDGTYDEFYLLDNPNYTGVCAITLNGDKIIASMNGGFSGGVYLNLLVVQDLAGNVSVNETIELYADDILCVDNTVYLVGSLDYSENDEWIGKIISYDLDSGDKIEKSFEANKPLLDVMCVGDKLYCRADTLNDGCYDIYIIDCATLEKTATLTFDKRIDGLLTYGDKLYCELGGKFCEIEATDGSIIKTVYDLPSGSYIEHVAANDGKIYVITRFETPTGDKKNAVVGTLAECDINGGTVTETIIRMNRKKHTFFVCCPAI